MTAGWIQWTVLALTAMVAFLIDRRSHRDPMSGFGAKRAGIETAVWTAVGLAFAFVVWALRDGHAATQYITGYTLEKSLSLDNVAVFAVIIASLKIAPARQRRVVDHGILGALVLRLLFIAGGLALLDRLHAVLYVFGAFLVVSGFRMARSNHDSDNPDHPPRVVTIASRILPISTADHGDRYFTRLAGSARRVGTTLLVGLVALAFVDVVFAVDSVPAIFSVSHDAWIVVAANAFALLGMRPMYFLLADGIRKLRYLQSGLAVILIGIGIDLLIEDAVALPTVATLGFVVAVLTASVAASLRHRGTDLPDEMTSPATLGTLPPLASKAN